MHGTVSKPALASLENGLTVEGVKYGPIEAALDRAQTVSANSWLNVTLREGKNREIRKVMEHLDLKVTRLIRVAYGPFQLGDLPEGAAKEVLPPKTLREQIPAFFA